MAAALVPVDAWETLPPLCPSRWLGLRCPGCGMTRALALLLHGRWREAIAMNPRVVVVAPLLFGFVLRWPVTAVPWTFNAFESGNGRRRWRPTGVRWRVTSREDETR